MKQQIDGITLQDQSKHSYIRGPDHGVARSRGRSLKNLHAGTADVTPTNVQAERPLRDA